MNSRRVLAVVVLLALMGSATVYGDESPLAKNAALQYWKGFALLPELSQQQYDGLRKALEDGKIDKSLEKLIAKSESALREFHKGAAMDECCWAVSYEEDMEAALPHLSKARQLICVALLRANTSFASGDVSGAVDDIVAVMTLARHGGQDELLVANLVDYAIERLAIDTLAANLPSLDPTQLRDLAERLESLPAAATVVDSIRVEKGLYEKWIVRVLSKPDGKKQLTATYGRTEKYAGLVKAIREHSEEELLSALKEAGGLYDRMAETYAKSPADVKQAEEQFAADPGLKGLAREMAAGLFPSIGDARLSEAEHQTRVALIKAAIAVQLDDPGVLENDAHRDPFGNGPFTHTKTPNGFELRSSLVDRKGEPVSLVVGRP